MRNCAEYPIVLPSARGSTAVCPPPHHPIIPTPTTTRARVQLAPQDWAAMPLLRRLNPLLPSLVEPGPAAHPLHRLLPAASSTRRRKTDSAACGAAAVRWVHTGARADQEHACAASGETPLTESLDRRRRVGRGAGRCLRQRIPGWWARSAVNPASWSISYI